MTSAWFGQGLEHATGQTLAGSEAPARQDPAAVATPAGPGTSDGAWRHYGLERTAEPPLRRAVPDSAGGRLSGGRAYGEPSDYQRARTERFGEPEMYTERQRQLEALSAFAGVVNSLVASGLGKDPDLALPPRDALRRIDAHVTALFTHMGWRP